MYRKSGLSGDIGEFFGKGSLNMYLLCSYLTFRSIRRETGAVLIVQPRDQLPACSQEGDELFEIKGKMDSVIHAFQTVCSLLRANMARTQAKAAAEAAAASTVPGALGVSASQAPVSVMTDQQVMAAAAAAAAAPGVALQAGGFGVGVSPGEQIQQDCAMCPGGLCIVPIPS